VKNLKHATTLKTIYSAGLRITEACKLRVTDIDSKRMLIRVQDPKGKRDRYTILSERLLKALRKYWIECRPESNDDFLFPSRGKAGYVTPEMIRKTFKKAMAAAGVTKKTSTHSLRHSFATHMLETGTDIRVIQALLGHRSIRVTGVYTHVSLAHLSRTTSPFDILGTPEASVMG
jgi:site-specific recombinase XerD